MGTNVAKPQDIPPVLAGIIEDLLAYLANLALAIGNWLAALVQSVIAQIGGIVTAIINSLTRFVSDLLDRITRVIDSVLASLERIVNSLAAFALAALDRIVTAVLTIVDRVLLLIRETRDRLLAVLGDLIDRVAVFIAGAIQAVINFVGTAIGIVEDLARVVRDQIVSWLGELVDLVDGVLEGVIEAVTSAFESLITGAQAVIVALIERIQAIGEQLQVGIDSLIQGITEQVGDKLDAIGEVAGEIGETIADLGSTSGAGDVFAAVQTALGGGSLFLRDRESALQFVRSVTPKNRLQAHVFYAVLSTAIVLKIYSGVADANAELILQEYGREHAYRLPSPPDAATALRRGLIDQGTYDHWVGSAGFASEARSTLFNLTRQPLAVGELMMMWSRGILDTDTVNDELHAHGLSDTAIAGLYQASRILPPLQDIITMAVRDVFDPAAVAEGALFAEFPAEVAVHANQQGLDREWAERYWGAHWRLPSEQMALEMFQRRIISFEQLNQLLKAQDIAPGWRSRITELAFNPLTRVDIRRMHQLGVLTEEDVLEAHLDLGYNPDHAQLLTQFVIRLNEGAPVDDEEDLGKLTRASVVGFYRDGVLPRTRAQVLLVSLGITPAAATLYLDAVDADIERAERKDQVDAIIGSAEAGTISFEEAQDRLNQVGLSTLEVTRALNRLTRALERQTRLPTKQEGAALLKAGIIGMEDYRALLARLGYAQRWVDAFATQAARGGGDG